MSDTDSKQESRPVSSERERAMIARTLEQDHTTFDAVTGVFSNGTAFGLACRMAERMAGSSFLPEAYRGNPDDCLILIDYAARLRMSPIALAQGMHVVKGKPGLSGALVISLINSSSKFDGDLQFEWCGQPLEPGKPIPAATGCRAFAFRNGERVNGPWVTGAMVDAEGWARKDASKWKSMPEVMFHYRAASFFGRIHAADVLLGMHSIEELEDVIEGESTRVTAADRINAKVEQALTGGVADAEFADVKDAPRPKRRSAKKEADPEPQESGMDVAARVFEDITSEAPAQEAPLPATTPSPAGDDDAFNLE